MDVARKADSKSALHQARHLRGERSAGLQPALDVRYAQDSASLHGPCTARTERHAVHPVWPPALAFDKEAARVNFAGMKTTLCLAMAFGCCAFMLPSVSAADGAAKKPAVGDAAPLVEGKDQDGKTWKLSRLIGKKIVLLYFYPKDDTAGCTKEACGFRDRMDELKKDNVEVIGVSFDTAENHQMFIEKHKLNFRLLADTEGKVADAYSARMAGKSIARRVSFLIGLDGKIAHITDNPGADAHLNEMKDAVAKLKSKTKA